MAGYVYTASQIRKGTDLITHILNTLTSGGGQAWFTVKNGSQADPNGHDLPPVNSVVTRHVLLESEAPIDGLIATDPSQRYRVFFEIIRNTADILNPRVTQVNMFVGSGQQLVSVGGGVSPTPDTPKITLWNAATEPTATRETNFRATLTDHGLVFAIWTVSNVNQVHQNVVVCIQRPVNPTTGEVKHSGNAPVFLLSHDAVAGSTENYFKFSTIREKLIASAQPLSTTNLPSPNNMYKVTLDWTHPNLFDNYTHIIKFPYGFCTSDHIYMDEMDLIAVVNGTAFASNQEVEITMYGEANERKYTTVWGDVEYGRAAVNNQTAPILKVLGGGRIAMLTSGGAITPDEEE